MLSPRKLLFEHRPVSYLRTARLLNFDYSLSSPTVGISPVDLIFYDDPEFSRTVAILEQNFSIDGISLKMHPQGYRYVQRYNPDYYQGSLEPYPHLQYLWKDEGPVFFAVGVGVMAHWAENAPHDSTLIGHALVRGLSDTDYPSWPPCVMQQFPYLVMSPENTEFVKIEREESSYLGWYKPFVVIGERNDKYCELFFGGDETELSDEYWPLLSMNSTKTVGRTLFLFSFHTYAPDREDIEAEEIFVPYNILDRGNAVGSYETKVLWESFGPDDVGKYYCYRNSFRIWEPIGFFLLFNQEYILKFIGTWFGHYADTAADSLSWGYALFSYYVLDEDYFDELGVWRGWDQLHLCFDGVGCSPSVVLSAIDTGGSIGYEDGVFTFVTYCPRWIENRYFPSCCAVNRWYKEGYVHVDETDEARRARVQLFWDAIQNEDLSVFDEIATGTYPYDDDGEKYTNDDNNFWEANVGGLILDHPLFDFSVETWETKKEETYHAIRSLLGT